MPWRESVIAIARGLTLASVKENTMRTPLRRLVRLRNTLSHRTFPADLRRLYNWPGKTNDFFGMNHDFVRASIILKVLRQLGVDAFIETGSHMGRTCFLIAAQTDLSIFSCEVNRHYFRIAQWFLKWFGARVHLSNVDSVEFLDRLLGHNQFRQPLFYLDAHWYSRLPLVEDLGRILSSVESFIIVIDDFRVPGDAHFGFDRYGDTALDWNLIEQMLRDSGRETVAYVPAYPSSIEVGDTRGWILLASKNNEAAITQTVPNDLLDKYACVSVA